MASKLFEGLIVFMGGISLLLAQQFGMNNTDKGPVTTTTLFGILIGAMCLGGLADHWGRKPAFIGEMVHLAVALIVAAFRINTPTLVASLLVIDVALGAEYPTAHLVISESNPANICGRLVHWVFSFLALGAVAAKAISAMVLTLETSLEVWRQHYLLPVIPAPFVSWGRFFSPEGSQWLVSKGKFSHAEKQLRTLLHRHDIELKALEIAEKSRKKPSVDWRQLFRGKYQRDMILASVP